MDAATIYQRFVERAPAAVLVHGLIESCLSPAFLDAIAAPHLPPSPNPRQLAFSHLIEILLPVVFESKKSVGQSYRDATHLHAVATLKCVYERLAGTPPAAVAALVAAVAGRSASLLDPHPPGTTRFLTLDGNHLAATQNRLADLAGLPAALPGQAMVLRDQATGVFLRVLLHDDGHTNERSLHQQLLGWCGPNDVVIADSCFCTEAFLIGMRRRGTGVLVRHHGGVGLTPLGERRDCGQVATGRVYETRVRYAQTQWEFRLVEVELDRPTREGQRTIGVLTDVAEETLAAVEVAAKYQQRRTIETAFQELAEGLRGEVETLAYPKAALLAFGLAVSVYNLLQVVRHAIQRQTEPGAQIEVSAVLLCQELSSYAAGLGAALEGNPQLPTPGWSATQLRAWVDELATRLTGARYAKSKRGHRKQPRQQSKPTKGSHTATARILEQRRRNCQ
jgi:Transposase DDE domain